MKNKPYLIIGLMMIAIVGILIYKGMAANNQAKVSQATLKEQISFAYQQNKPMWLLFHSQT